MEHFKKFWVVSVNNFICDAAYNGKELKAKHRYPSFREFHLIKNPEALRFFSPRTEISNEELCKKLLNQ